MGSQSAAANSARTCLGFDSDRTQQKGRQMPAVVGIGGLGRRLGRAARPHVVQTGNWRRNAIASGRRSASMPAATARSLFTVVSLLVVSGAAVAALAVPVFTVPMIGAAGPIFRRFRRGDPRFTAHPGNALTDQLLDRGDALRVRRGDHGNGSPGSSGAPGAADAMNVVVGMMRDVEIEDVTDRRNVEAARGDVGSHQQCHFVLAKLVERGSARGRGR